MTKLTDIFTYDMQNLIIEKPKEKDIPNSAMKYHSAEIKTRFPDGTIGDLVISTEKLFSKGIAEGFKETPTAPVSGYTLPMFGYSKDGATDKQKKWFEQFEKIIQTCKTDIFKNRKDYKKANMKEHDTDKLASSIIWWPTDESGEVSEDAGPVLYPKLLYSKSGKNAGKIWTKFYRMGTTSKIDDPFDLLNKYGFVKAAIKIESIYKSGDKIKLQIKVLEADFQESESASQKLLPVSDLVEDERFDDKNSDSDISD